MSMPQAVLGVDLGGTSLRVALVVDGTVVDVVTRSSILTQGERHNPATVMLELCRRVAGHHPILAVGVAAAGPVDIFERRICNPYTLPDWSGSDWPDVLSTALGLPVLLENDAAAAAVAELRAGAGKGAEVLCMVTVGTGIGVAVVTAGSRRYHGARGAHPEAGHMLISDRGNECYCGYVGCWESLCSGRALASQWTSASADMEMVVDWDGYARVFARGIVNLERIYAPDLIVIGGGVADSLANFLPALRGATREPDPMIPGPRALIVRARLQYPGAYGAACLAIDAITQRSLKGQKRK
jgi:glucokinase